MSRKSMRKGLNTYCPACGIDIHFRKLPRRGHNVNCFECKSLLEVVRLAPLTLEWAFEEPFDGVYADSSDFEYGADGQKDDSYELDFVDVEEDWDDDWNVYDDVREDDRDRRQSAS